VKKYGIDRQTTDDIMAHALDNWMNKVTNTHSEYEILFAYPRQLWLHERAWKLH